MGKTTLTNNVGLNVQVKEGNNFDISRNLQVLKPGNSMTIRADRNATAQYVLILLPDNKKLRPLTSDDIQELPAIEIFKDDVTGDYDWRKLQKGAEKKSWFDIIFCWFSPKPGAKADAKANLKADANVEANTEALKSPTAPFDEAGPKTRAEADTQTTANAESSTAPP